MTLHEKIFFCFFTSLNSDTIISGMESNLSGYNILKLNLYFIIFLLAFYVYHKPKTNNGNIKCFLKTFIINQIVKQ
jgi:hypothetical protein